MRVAVFLDNVNYEELNKFIKEVFIFDIDDNSLKVIGEETILIDNVNYTLTWLLSKKVNIIYANTNNEAFEIFIQSSGIKIMPLDEIKNNPALESLLIKSGY
ncbi:MAG: hypothetical protein LBL90_02460 [Prevotellaceae bacterium]|jgi:hypothetical protein|nr:hypothetical protein [Prevotellaceae bacterium]